LLQQALQLLLQQGLHVYSSWKEGSRQPAAAAAAEIAQPSRVND